jgi:hypothetical protein
MWQKSGAAVTVRSAASRCARAARARAFADRSLSREEVEQGLRTPIGDDERAEVLSLVAWFCRRYPTPLERLAYERRAYRRWQATASARPER